MIIAPPRHSKSEHVSRRLPAYILGRNPDATIIACSHSAHMAASMNRSVQRIIDSDAYRVLFPDTRLFGQNIVTRATGTWLRNSSVFEVVGRRGVYQNYGVGQGIAGAGANYVIIDDPFKKDEEAYSPVIRQKIYDWYGADVYTRVEGVGGILLTNTRWHRDDLAGRLLKDMAGEGDKWTVLHLPAIREDEPCEYDPREPGEALWPWKKTIEELRQIESVEGPTKWAALYQGKPRAEGGAEWPDTYFGPEIWFDEWPRTPACKVIALDPSKGVGGKHGDYSAFVIVLLAPDGTLYVDADMRNDRNMSIIIETAFELQNLWKPDRFGVETNQFQELMADVMAKDCLSHGIANMPVMKIDNRVNKEIRIRRLSSWLSQHKVRFKHGSRGAKLLVEQLIDFPNADHDDGPDALEMAVRMIRELYRRQSSKRFDDGLGSNVVQALGQVF